MSETNEKEERNIIKLLSGARYEIKGGTVYSLNWAERGMHGQTMGKALPEHLAKEVMLEYNQYKDYRNRVSTQPKPAKKGYNPPKAKTAKKLKKTAAARKIQKKTKKTSVSLSKALRNRK